MRVHQALLGYAQGHQLLASSVELNGAAARLLRTATDMAFDGRSESYLSVFPLADADLHAFVRTWPGPAWQRAGSVWSHAIFLDPVQLSRTENFSLVSDLFRRPQAASAKALSSEVTAYAKALSLPKTAKDAKREAPFDRELAAAVAAEFYLTDERVDMGVGNRNGIDEMILALLSQQWPGLRRAFSARTRSRTSDAAWQVGLQIVDRPVQRDLPPAPAWANFLAADMERPSKDFRDFLGRYGAENRSGRLAMSPLVSLYRALSASDVTPMRKVSVIRERFDQPRQMRLLKRDLVGPSSVWSPPGWPQDEADRLMLAFSLGSAADFGELHLTSRLVQLILSSPLDPRIQTIPLSHLSPDQVDELLGAVVEQVNTDQALTLATAHPDFGLLVAARKPQILEHVSVWEALDPELVVTVFSGLSEEQQQPILERLLEDGAVHPLLLICERNPDAWWRLLFAAAGRDSTARNLMDRATTLRSVLDRVGSAAIGLPAKPARTPVQVMYVLLAADLSAGLWRRCPPATWQRLATAINADPPAFEGAPRYVYDRVHAVALLTAGASASGSERTSGWKQSFGYLHERLKHDSFDGEAWRVLANTLPSGGPDWDRCQRLRKGLVAEIRRDKWPRQSIDVVVAAAGVSGKEILGQIKPAEPSRRKSVLQEFIDHLFS